jgi:hypothetical protein
MDKFELPEERAAARRERSPMTYVYSGALTAGHRKRSQ